MERGKQAMSNYENLMYAAQGLSLPYCENHRGGEDASYPLTEDEQNEIINHRINHPMTKLNRDIFKKTTREKIIAQSVEFFGKGKELLYVVEGCNGLEERRKIVGS